MPTAATAPSIDHLASRPLRALTEAELQNLFTSFAVPTILGELRRYFRDTGWGVHVPRGQQEAAMRVEKAAKELTNSAGREPSPRLIAEYLEWSLEEVVEALEAGAGHFSSSLDAPVRDEAGEIGTLIGTIAVDDDGYAMVEARLSMAEAIRKLPMHTRQVIAMRFTEQLTQQQIADRLGVSRMQISRLLRAGLETVRREHDV